MLKVLFILPICIILLCGPRFFTQSVAWAGMLLDRVPDQGLVDGWNDTFDGDSPCALCLAIEKSGDADNKATEHEKRELHFTALCIPQHRLDHSAQELNGLNGLQLWHLNCYYNTVNKRPPIS